jgi:hypothetical protein
MMEQYPSWDDWNEEVREASMYKTLHRSLLTRTKLICKITYIQV